MNSKFASLSRCHQSDLYELAVMHRRSLTLHFRQGEAICRIRLTPKDLQAKGGREYLVAVGEEGQAHMLALDDIVAVEEFETELQSGR